MKKVIWSNDIDTIESLKKDIMQEKNMEESEAYNLAYQQNTDDLDIARDNLNICVGEHIIMLAHLALWDGGHRGYRLLMSNKISDCLKHTEGFYVTWYVDNLGDLRCEDIHQDGTNDYLCRSWKPGISETRKKNFLVKFCEGKATRADITRCTDRLGDHISRVYGWNLRGR